MSSPSEHNPYKEKFRPESDPALDQEVEAAVGDLSMDDLLYGEQSPRPAAAPADEPGVRRGRVMRITPDDVFVDFGGKSQGVAPLAQFEAEPKVGDEIDFTVDRYDAREGLLILSRKGAAVTKVTWENLAEGQIVEGTVTATNKGGLEVDVKGMRAFMPAGQVDIYHVPDLEGFVGQKVTAEVTQYDRESRNLVLSRRNILEREREAARQKLMEELAEDQVRRGVVRNVTDFGAFVDLGGVDGLVHVSEMSFRRVRHPGEVVNVGDIVQVKVTKVDREEGKIGLSLKQAMADPWVSAAEKYAPGTSVTGRVTKVEAFGAFIEVEEGIEGLLPVSEMSWGRINHPKDMVGEGDTLRLVVLSIDPAQRRMSFSLKQAGEDPWSGAADRYAADMVVEGTVTRVTDFGAFIELETGVEGLVHISELSDRHVRTPGDVVKAGQPVRVRVLEMDAKNRRIGLSIRRADEPTPAEAASAPAGAKQAPEPAKKKRRPVLRGGLDF